MNTPTQNEYLLLFRGAGWDKGLSPEQIQKVVSQWAEWFQRLTEEGRCKGGQPLRNEGKIVSGRNRLVADGPFAESKEAIGGYFLLQVDDLDGQPIIKSGTLFGDLDGFFEVRPVAEQCMAKERLEKEQLVQGAAY